MPRRLSLCMLLSLLFACGPQAPDRTQLSGSTLTYYEGLDHLEGETLKMALHERIREAIKLNYNQVWSYMRTADADPTQDDRMIMVYSQKSLPASSVGGGEDASGWNREHVWPSSRGFSRTNMPAHTDLHNLRACEVTINRLHGDMSFGEAPAGLEVPGAPGTRYDKAALIWEPSDEVKGDIARTLLYMDVRYQGGVKGESDLRLVEKLPAGLLKGHDAEGNGYLENLHTLLRWHEQDPVDAAELRRQEKVFAIQKNRNPFIDHPEYARLIYGY